MELIKRILAFFYDLVDTSAKQLSLQLTELTNMLPMMEGSNA